MLFTSRPEVNVWAKPDKYSLNTRDGQYGQVLEIAKLFKNKKNGFFIEAGAYDGEIYSNTLKFEMDLNWTGLLVEPNPDVFEALLTKNRKSYAIKTCLSTKPEVTEVSFDMAGKYLKRKLKLMQLAVLQYKISFKN